MNPVSLVNPLQGTDSVPEYSTGNTLPLLAQPWGLHHWTLQTREDRWLFHPRHRHLQGIRLTHQPSPWIGDYASLVVMPFTGAAMESLVGQASSWNIDQALIQPNYLRVDLLRYEIRVEMAPSARGALFSFEFPEGVEPRVAFHFEGGHELSLGADGKLHGKARNASGEVPPDFGLSVLCEFSVAPAEFTRTDFGGWVSFAKGVTRLELRLAASFISNEVASVTMARELAGKSLGDVAGESGDAWNDLLGRIGIEMENHESLRTFYSCLYRCLLFPRRFDEIDGTGAVVHYSPYKGGVLPGPLCTDNGFWDTFRTVYPLLALVYPDKLTGILEGWLAACREAGWSPKWASPGLRDCMIGTHYDAVVADAVAKGVTDWDVAGAFEFLEKNATISSDDGHFGRRGLRHYIDLGYVPADKVPYALSRTLDFAYNDFCVAQVAAHLGRTELAEKLHARAQSYRNVFDPAVDFMRAKSSDGKWSEPFGEFMWGGAYIEGGPWQHTFNVPHDPAGLAALFGGNEALCRKLDTMLETPAKFEIGTYPYEIHEMTEMALADYGQYAHSNQPVHNFLFLYALCGEPEKTAHWVHRVATEAYTLLTFPGDEDNGEMAAWYVFACLGVFPFCPGRPEYVRFPGVAKQAEIMVPGRDPVILTPVWEGAPIVTHRELTGR